MLDGLVPAERTADEGHERPGRRQRAENWLSVLASSPIAIAATITVSGAAMSAVSTISANPEKKLIAGAMLASVAAEISKFVRTREPDARARAVARQ